MVDKDTIKKFLNYQINNCAIFSNDASNAVDTVNLNTYKADLMNCEVLLWLFADMLKIFNSKFTCNL